MFDTILFLLGLSLTMLKGAFQALAVIYPSYKTYKALESRSLKASQSMLLYWCITAFVGATKEFADQLLGSYANFFVWKTLILVLKAAPLIIGPDRMYNALIKPIFDSQEEKVDAVVDELHQVKALAVEAVPAIKEGDVTAAKEKASEIVEQIKSSELVHSIQEQAVELTHALEAKSKEMGFAWDRNGVMGVLEQIVAQFEGVRDYSADIASEQWSQHGPMVMRQTEAIRGQANQYAPVVKAKAVDLWTTQVAPRVQPIITTGQTKYTETIKPVILAKRDQAAQLWQAHGGPVRRFYSGQVRPFYKSTVSPFIQNQFMPFMTDSFLPAVYETLLVLKDKLLDIWQTPTEEVKSSRVQHKRRRADARKEKRTANKPIFEAPEPKEGQLYKRQKTNLTSDAADLAVAQTEANVSADKSTTSADIDRSEGEGMTSHPQASLLNRRTHTATDSSIEKRTEKPQLTEDIQELADKSDLHADAPVFEPIGEKALDAALHASVDKNIADKTMERTGSGEKLGQWAGEPRANDATI